MTEDKTVLATTEARQGVTKDGRVLKILLVSLALAVVLLLLSYFAFFPKAPA